MKHIRHAVRATGYSLAGLKRLMQETAAQAEVLFYLALLVLYALLGAEAIDFALITLFFLLTFALEALNTAVEVLVDHLTMQFAEFARQAKDLGSFAVMCGLILMTSYSGWVVYKYAILR